MKKITIDTKAPKRTFDCNSCKQPCCEGYIYIRATMDAIIILPLTKKKMCIDGIPLKRVSPRLWRCEWLNRKTRKCKNYEGRPTICRTWYCPHHKIWDDKRQAKKLRDTMNTSILGLCFPLSLRKKRGVN